MGKGGGGGGGRECSLLSILSPFYVTNVLNIISALKVILCYPKSKYEFLNLLKIKNIKIRCTQI